LKACERRGGQHAKVAKGGAGESAGRNLVPRREAHTSAKLHQQGILPAPLANTGVEHVKSSP